MKVMQNFLTSEDLSTLRRISKTCYHSEGARPGIYKYGTVSLRSGTTNGIPDDLYQKILVASGLTPPFNGRCIQQFISYTQGGFIHAHKDWVYDLNFVEQLRTITSESKACKLYRVNMMVDSAAKGGELFVDGEEVKLNEGDALIFRPELQEHEVKPILEGSRMIFTCGFHHKEM